MVKIVIGAYYLNKKKQTTTVATSAMKATP